MTNPEESIEREVCTTCREGWVIYFVDGVVIPERCPDECDEGFVEDDSYDRHYEIQENEATGN